MIYLIVFIYLLYLSVRYDILGREDYRWTHYRIAVTLLILVAGLRWRVGSDTVSYASDFYFSHDLFHLEWSDFESVMKMPLWVLLQATCKTIWNDFLLFQFVVAAFGIGMIAYFIKKVCPSLCFFILLCFFIGRYTATSMEHMRGSLSIIFFLLGILAVNDGKTKKFLLYFLVAVLFHVFTIFAVFLFVIGYYLIPRKPAIYWLLCVAMIVPILVGKDFMTPIAEGASLFLPSEDMASRITAYAVNDGKTKKFLLYFLVAVLFHVFTIFAVFLFVIGYYLIPRKPAIYWLLCVAMIVPILVGKDFMTPIAEGASLFLPSEDMASRITAYATSEWFGNKDLSIINYVWMVAQLIVYVFMLHKTQVIYPQYIRLKQDLFQTCVCIALLLVCARYSLMILYRMVDYFYFFTLFLSVMFAKGILIDRIVRRQKILVFCVLLLFPLFFGAKAWLNEDIIGGSYTYSRYYPYSSVFDKSLDPEREKHHQLRGSGWSVENDY